MRVSFCAVIISLFSAVEGWTQNNNDDSVPSVVVSDLTLQWFDRIPRLPDNGFSCMREAKSFRTNLSVGRQKILHGFEAYRIEVCRDIESFDRRTERRMAEGSLSPNDYSDRKNEYMQLFNEHCNPNIDFDKRSGLLALFDSINGELSRVEQMSKTLLDDCYADGACYGGSCSRSGT